MAWLVTGSAGFIGFHVASYLVDRGERVIGIDNLNAYYDVALKEARLARLEERSGFEFHRIDVTDLAAMTALVERHTDIDAIIHLAAQAGVRHSLADPLAYVDANVKGQVVVLEAARQLKALKSIAYASSSSVYGNSTKQPVRIDDRVEHPVSLYAATKRAAEVITESYCQLYALPCTGLRFFTLYGPWGRPDMAYYAFTDAILHGRPIRVFNKGRRARHFTFARDAPPAILAAARTQGQEHRLYNIGSNRPEALLDVIAIIEKAVGRAAIREMVPMQPGDVEATYADIKSTQGKAAARRFRKASQMGPFHQALADNANAYIDARKAAGVDYFVWHSYFSNPSVILDIKSYVEKRFGGPSFINELGWRTGSANTGTKILDALDSSGMPIVLLYRSGIGPNAPEQLWTTARSPTA